MKDLILLRHLLIGLLLSVNVFCVSATGADTTRHMIPEIQYSFQPKQLILPASLITVGALGTTIHGMNDFHLFKRKEHTHRIRLDDYLEWGMLGWVFVCDLVGKEKHSFVDQFFILAVAEGMNAGMVRGLKRWINEPRPDGGPHSFPSGHTSNVFLGAHLAYKEFKDSSAWLAYSGYAVGAFVGFSRIYNNRHWVADVVAGAGFGILSVELAYLIYFPVRNWVVQKINNRHINRVALYPSVQSGGAAFHLSFCF